MYPETSEFFCRATRKNADKLSGLCKRCKSERDRRYRIAHSADIKAKKSEYYAKHKESISVRMSRYQKDHLEAHRKRSEKYRQSNLDKCRAAGKKSAATAYAINPEKFRQKARDYRKQNPQAKRSQEQRRRSRKLRLPATLTANEWESILADYGYACAYCGVSWVDAKLTQDHVIPLAQNGGYTAGNIVPACGSCNCRKNNRTPEQAGMPLLPKRQ